MGSELKRNRIKAKGRVSVPLEDICMSTGKISTGKTLSRLKMT